MLRLLWCALLVGAATLSVRAERPNVILILADDLGYGDIGPFGQKRIATPALDQLAGEGTVFTDVYAAAPVCAPSRCALLTGLHTGHARVRGNAGDRPRQPPALALQPEDVTLAQLFRRANYVTGAVGKWGLGDAGPEASGMPTRQGFDSFFGYLNQTHAHNSYPSFLWRNEARIRLPNEVPQEGPLGTGVSSNRAVFAEDLFIQETLDFIRTNRDRPFFLYFAPTLPHANNESLPVGMEIPALGEYAARDWPEAEKRFAAVVTRLDADVGRMLALLRELNLDQNTVVIFTSDNGAHREGGHDPDFFQSSGPLRGIKRDLSEGGIRVPAIVRWPGQSPAGSREATPWGLVDLFATFADLAGVAAPPNDGASVLPLWRGRRQPALEERPLYWEFYERGFQQAGRIGRWKAIKPSADGAMELYDLSSDLFEKRNVAAGHPQLVERFEALFAAEHTPSPFWLKGNAK